jgi:MFS family permease
MKEQRWLRIIPVALIMYTISYIDRTNVALGLDPKISSMMKDLFMDDKMKGHAAGIFFFGYILLQIPGGYLANRWSARKVISIFLVLWGICAVGCGLVTNFRQFEVMRFLLGVAESGVFPATLVLLANWFPRTERARANAFWNLCQPLAVAGSAPLTGWILEKWPSVSERILNHQQFGLATHIASLHNWQAMLIVEGALPFLWLPIWLYFISDHPREAKWISEPEKEYLEKTLQREAAALETVERVPIWRAFLMPAVFVMLPIYFLQNCAAYGCNTFLTEGLKGGGHSFTGFQTGILFALPYVLAVVVMILNSWHSDKTNERRAHVAAVYFMSGIALIASVLLKERSFWLSYAFLCFAIPGPFASLAPFWAIPSETMPRNVLGSVMGLVNAIGNVGGFLGPYFVGTMKKQTNGVTIPFSLLGLGLLAAGALCFLLPKMRKQEATASPSSVPAKSLP